MIYCHNDKGELLPFVGVRMLSVDGATGKGRISGESGRKDPPPAGDGDQRSWWRGTGGLRGAEVTSRSYPATKL